MNRFAAMQLWPVFWKRAVTATSTAFSRLASSSTMNGSEPPSSSTTGLIARPAASPTATPAASEPVRVTPAIRRSPISSLALRPETTIVLKTPGAAPARSKTCSSSRRAAGHVGGVLEHEAVARRDDRRRRPHRLPERVVPRHDREHRRRAAACGRRPGGRRRCRSVPAPGSARRARRSARPPRRTSRLRLRLP